MPKGIYKRKSIERRFWSKVKIHPFAEDLCWNWLGNKTKKGYGALSVNGKKVSAHRVSYALFDREFSIYSESHIDHLCLNKSCVNPCHLDKVTHRENIKRSKALNKSKSSKYVGVYWHSPTKRWRAIVQLGSFKDELEAKRIYDKISNYLESIYLEDLQPSNLVLSRRSTINSRRRRDLKC